MKTVLAIGLVLVAGLLYLTIPRAESATGAQASPESADVLERSSELTAAAAPGSFGSGTVVPAPAARGLADGLAEDIPLPRGGSFDGIQWEAAGGAFSAAETRAILQYNAMCQWVRAYRDGRQTDVSGRILAEVPSWSAWRGAETGTALGAAIAELLGGGGSASAALLRECDVSHEREVRYAEARGLDPSR